MTWGMAVPWPRQGWGACGRRSGGVRTLTPDVGGAGGASRPSARTSGTEEA